jgi:hypothetical protein
MSGESAEIIIFFSGLLFIAFTKNINVPVDMKILMVLPILIMVMEYNEVRRINIIMMVILFIIKAYLVDIFLYINNI